MFFSWSAKMTTRFFHLRNIDWDNNGNLDSRGGRTFAFREVEMNSIIYAVARCNPKDNYNKRLGRAKAEGRLDSPRYCKLFEGTRKEFIDAILDCELNESVL